MDRTILSRLLEDRRAKTPVVLATWLETGEQRLIYREEIDPDDALGAAAASAFRSDRSTTVSLPEGEVFLHVQNPPLRMIVVGAVHIAQHLVPLAVRAGYAVTVIDPRGAFATPERFPQIDLRPEWPDEIWDELDVDRRTAIVALTHDPKIDDPALSRALRSEAFYIGALGSRKTNAARHERLVAGGLDVDSMARLHAPIGLDIGAKGAVEIAISVMAEVTQALRKPRGAAA